MLATTDILSEAAQRDGLNQALERWFARPLYRTWGSEAPHAGNLTRQPMVTKHDLRTHFPANFIAPGEPTLEALLAANEVELEYTSGTSEERVPVLLPRGWWDAQEAKALRLNGTVARILDDFPEPRRVTLTTPVCNGQACPSKWLTRAQRTLGRTLFVNHARIPFLLSEDELDQMARDTFEWEPQLLDLDPVHGAWFALYCERRGIRLPSLRFILCSYEFMSCVHRRIIERVFGVPVLNLYGATESGHLLMEGDDGDMLPSRETAYLEIVEPDERGIGPLVVTSLSNHRMPLVRYRIGDLVEAETRPYRTAYRVHGRARDALRDARGRRVTTWNVDQCLAGVAGIAHYQVRQDEQADCVLRFIPEGAGPSDADLNRVSHHLHELLESKRPVPVERVDTIVPSQSGKFRLTHPA